MSKLTHLNAEGEARMVDVGHKSPSERRAIAEGRVALTAPTIALIRDGALPKGDVLATARIAGIMAAKRTADLIPLCHPIALTSVAVDLAVEDAGVRITATVKTQGVTGVEMEALTAVSVAALALYDMVKAVEREAVIEGIALIEKTGGKSGAFRAGAGEPAPASPRKRTAPRTLMDPAAVPARPANDDARREHFRSYLASHRIQVLALAKSAGLAPGLIYGYLHGRTRRLSADAEAALAGAAKTSPKALFGSHDDAQRR